MTTEDAGVISQLWSIFNRNLTEEIPLNILALNEKEKFEDATTGQSIHLLSPLGQNYIYFFRCWKNH